MHGLLYHLHQILLLLVWCALPPTNRLLQITSIVSRESGASQFIHRPVSYGMTLAQVVVVVPCGKLDLLVFCKLQMAEPHTRTNTMS
mmetsp:Transcript_19824/g.59020  ORF Transcript_19824/g.59020 Transcript_19824/m.59020 type:complete len:87 (-) Transcript_19824:475-735(-)